MFTGIYNLNNGWMNVQFKQNLQRQFLDHQNDRLLSREKYIFNKPFIFILSLKTFSELFFREGL